MKRAPPLGSPATGAADVFGHEANGPVPEYDDFIYVIADSKGGIKMYKGYYTRS